MRPWILAETNYAHVKDNPYEVAVLPLGATEPHNLHLPYGTDMLEGTIVGERICQAGEQGKSKLVGGCTQIFDHIELVNNDCKLVTGKTANHRILWQCILEPFCHGLQCRITGKVAKGVINFLELVDVHVEKT